MIKTITLAAASFAVLTSVSHASEPTVLYDAAGSAVVAHLRCDGASPVVLYTAERKPIAAYLHCPTATTNVVVVHDRKGPIEKIVTSDRSQARRVARRVVRRNDD